MKKIKLIQFEDLKIKKIKGLELNFILGGVTDNPFDTEYYRDKNGKMRVR
jgi:hypothetical protein